IQNMTYYGMQLYAGDRFQVSNNSVTNCGSHGIIVSTAKSVYSYNTCNYNGGYGIHSTGDSVSVINLFASGNTLGTHYVTGSASGITVQSASFSELKTNLTSSTFMYKSANATVNAYSSGFSLSRTSGTEANIVIPIAASVWTNSPYLVINAASNSTANMSYILVWNNSTVFETVYSYAPVSEYAGNTVIDLTRFLVSNSADSLWLYIYNVTGGTGSVINFNEMYFTNIQPLY
ncbi:MAG: hypothetical protein ACYC5K_10690, partial [Saccharofermentanales bacterium]